MRFEETPLDILSSAYRELNPKADKEITVDALLEATKDKGIERWQVEDFLRLQCRGEQHPRKYFDGL